MVMQSSGFYFVIRFYSLAVHKDIPGMCRILDPVPGSITDFLEQVFIDTQEILPFVNNEPVMLV